MPRMRRYKSLWENAWTSNVHLLVTLYMSTLMYLEISLLLLDGRSDWFQNCYGFTDQVTMPESVNIYIALRNSPITPPLSLTKFQCSCYEKIINLFYFHIHY